MPQTLPNQTNQIQKVFKQIYFTDRWDTNKYYVSRVDLGVMKITLYATLFRAAKL